MHSIAEIMYQSGASREQALARGADAAEFDRLEEKWQGASIPTHIWVGFKYTPPYSCEYHTGGARGALLRRICQEQRHAQ